MPIVYPFTGLVEDSRTEEQKAKDYQYTELYSATPIVWMEKSQDQWRKFSLRDQDGSGSCVGQGSAKALEALYGSVISAKPIYSRRPNKPEKGMWLQASGDILYKLGTCPESVMVSQHLNEEQMNDIDDSVSTPLKVAGYGFIAKDNIDQIAQSIDQHKAVVLTFHSTYAEWSDIPRVDASSTTFWGHCVCAVDYILYNGVKALIIEDSWGHATSLGNGGQRIITEDYLLARCTGAMFLIPGKGQYVVKPRHYFTQDLKIGTMHNTDVKALQECLKYEGFFPASVDCTGNFLEATKNAVIKFQEKYREDILVPLGLTQGTGNVLARTRAKLNSLFWN